VRPLTPTNALAMHRIELASHKTPWSLKNIESSLARHECIGLWDGSSLIGYAIFSLVAPEGELLLFVISTQYQGQGVGKQFLAGLLQAWSALIQSLFLEVRESNASAIAVYESVGFNQVGLRPNYYAISGQSQKENALLFALEFVR